MLIFFRITQKSLIQDVYRFKSYLPLILLLVLSCQTAPEPTKIIFETDFGGDADDLGALAMIHEFQRRNELELIGITVFNTERYTISAIDAVNTFYGYPDIPIGLRNGESHLNPWNHSKAIADVLPFDLDQSDAEDAVKLYRRLLSTSKDQEVIIVSVGPMKNILDLLNSPADALSPLNGNDLLHAKVKEMVIMGRNFPESNYEWNFGGDMPGVTKAVLEQLDLPITFLGAEIGDEIRTGQVFNQISQAHPLYLGFYHFSQYAPWVKDRFGGEILDNATFDQGAILYAARGGIGQFWNRVVDGRCVADSLGGNKWVSIANSKHSYLKLSMPIAEAEKQFEAFMLGNFQ